MPLSSLFTSVSESEMVVVGHESVMVVAGREERGEGRGERAHPLKKLSTSASAELNGIPRSRKQSLLPPPSVAVAETVRRVELGGCLVRKSSM